MTIHITEHHKSHRTGWLRAAVLGANDGIVSTASLIIGVAAANAESDSIFLAGFAGLVAGAMSMAAGEYVSVSSQSDTEQADLELEKKALKTNYDGEIVELAEIYQQRGLNKDLATQVAEQLMQHDALGTHARDEIGISDVGKAQPLQAAFSSATSFTIGGLLPLLAFLVSPQSMVVLSVALSSLLALAVLGAISAKAGGAPMLKAISRVVFWGAAAMIVTATIGHIFNVSL